MITALAAWHYPHRTMEENIEYFADQGFRAISLNGGQLTQVLEEEERGRRIAQLVSSRGLVLTVHHALPASHSEEDRERFARAVGRIAAWQRRYGAMAIYSFDVPQKIRDGIGPYLRFVMEQAPDIPLAVEDFGLNDGECSQLTGLAGDRLGILVDIGHMFIRLTGANRSGATLFSPSPLEACEGSWQQRFAHALRAKPLPILEVHLHNNDGDRDMHWFLEEGGADMAAVSAALDEVGFDGVLTIESAPGYQFPCYGQEADEGILRTRAYWEAIRSGESSR